MAPFDDNEHAQHASSSWLADCSVSPPEVRPMPLRTTTEPERVDFDPQKTRSLLATTAGRSQSHMPDWSTSPSARRATAERITSSPPITPGKAQDNTDFAAQCADLPATLFDFSQIDYQLDRARRIGEGLWSSVYLAEPVVVTSPLPPKSDVLTPPSTPQRKGVAVVASRLFAIKKPARPDSYPIFHHEAKILTKLQQLPRATQHIVAFHGADPRNSALVFEGVIGGSLEDLSSRLKMMTELSRHLELRQLFPGLASDLIAGLAFIHDADVIHADIKPANILLDISDAETGRPALRARYIDFSASFSRKQGSPGNAGGTWDYMAPEQLRIQSSLNQPSFASDVWSLGITFLFVVAGGSPYASACGTNLFLLREAIKSGDPLGFAQSDPVIHKRMLACQDFIDCCRLALQKDRDRRCAASVWARWVEEQGFGTWY